MLVQALRFVDHMREAAESGRYLDTFTCLEEERSSGARSAEDRICGDLHQLFEKTRKEKHAACVEKRNALLTARRIVASADLDAFAGRLAVSCPTRGGEVFNNVVTLLAAGSAVPHLQEKIEALLTGKLGEADAIAEGSSWVHCPSETARQLQLAMGEEAFAMVELKMRGTWGHVYRESDLPNRHGHCTSNPNSELTVNFSGFRLATDGSH